MRILGLETSCDETGIAIYDSSAGLLAHALHSQVAMHADYGGVVPELASRDHIKRILPLIKEVLKQANSTHSQINALAYTAGPGLLGALLVGASVARTLAWGWGVPALAIHHLEGHLLAPMLEPEPPSFPFLCLLVSGGHTLLVNVQALGKYEILGESIDDAAGEAFDKTAKLLGLGYPGGAALAKLAMQGTPGRFRFPRPMTDRPGLDFSFSGLKTHALTTLKRLPQSAEDYADVAYAFEDAIVDTLCIKTRRAIQQTNACRLVVAGGVGANQRLRSRLTDMANTQGVRVHYPRIEFCTDNGAMIAFAGYLRLVHGGGDTDLAIHACARWNLTNLDTNAV